MELWEKYCILDCLRLSKLIFVDMVLRRVMDGFYISDLLMYNSVVFLYLLGFYLMFLFF